MTAAVASLSRQGRLARVLRLEIRRSEVRWAIPLIAALFFFDTYRTATGLPPVWTVRSSVITDNMLDDFVVFAAGLAAWVGSREGRRKTGDLLTTTVRPAWARQAAALGGTLFWLLLIFLAGVAVLYVQTARQATWGGPPLWPVAVGVAAVVTVTAGGFTVGTIFPGRFTAPLAAVAAFVVFFAAYHAGLKVTPTSGRYGLLSPATAVPLGDDGVFYHVAPDVAIAEVMFMGGITVALLGVLALFPVLRGPYRGLFSAISRTGRWLCAAGVVLLAAGVAASWTAFSLTGTAKLTVSGWDIPALHDAASDRPIPYTPDCAGSTFTVCVHPAFSAYLGAAAAALQPVAAEIAGLPGAPVRAEQVPSGDGLRATEGMWFPGLAATGVIGTPPVYDYSSDNPEAPLWGSPEETGNPVWRHGFQQGFLTAYVVGQGQIFNPSPAQQAVVTALMAAVGSPAPQFGQTDGPNGQPVGPSPAQIAAAAQRFGSLSAAARHTWLATRIAALRAGNLTLAQIP
jgi:hypothetical protein